MEENKEHNKMKFIIVAIAAAVVLVCGLLLFTTSKSARIKQVEKFAELVSEKYSNYSESDLKKAEEKFEKIIANVEKKELSGEEVSHINQLKGECKGYFAQAHARLILDEFNQKLDDAGDEVKGAMKSLIGDDE